MKKVLMAGMLVLTGVSLSACLGRSAPDEMAVYDGQPLSLPPSFELRPPREGEEKMAASTASGTEAQDVLFGGSQNGEKDMVMAESWLLEKAGGEGRDPSIREKLSKEEPKTEE